MEVAKVNKKNSSSPEYNSKAIIFRITFFFPRTTTASQLPMSIFSLFIHIISKRNRIKIFLENVSTHKCSILLVPFILVLCFFLFNKKYHFKSFFNIVLIFCNANYRHHPYFLVSPLLGKKRRWRRKKSKISKSIEKILNRFSIYPFSR